MTIAAYLNTEYVDLIATEKGWADLAEHIRTTGVQEYPNAHHLAEFGWTHFVIETRAELKSILTEHPPRKAATKKTLGELVAALAPIKPAPDDALVISDGLS